MNRPDARNPLREFTDARIAPGAAAPVCRPAKSQLWSGPCQSAGCHSSAVRQPTIGGAAGGARPQALTVHSAAPDRHTYLRRPDLGRQLADESRADLAASGVRPADLLLVIGDGLSSGR